jgi:hypothetical protein
MFLTIGRKFRLRSQLRDESGQAIIEYILLLSLIFTVSAAFSRRIISALDSSITVFNGTLEKDLRTGRIGVGIWEN